MSSNSPNIVWAQQVLPKSIFLAGPTPREKSVLSWRPKAVAILNELSFDGHIFIPEENWDETSDRPFEYDHQIEWEWRGLDRASTIVFWIPREIATMPGFTTNVEFGLTIASSKVLLGYPKGTPKSAYLKALAERYHAPVYHDLRDILTAAAARP